MKVILGKRKNQVIKYIIADFLTASIAWMFFFAFRRLYIEPLSYGYKLPLEAEKKLILGMMIIPVFWILLYYLSGYYKDIFRKSRLKDIGQTFLQSVSGIILLFFVLILDDVIESYRNYYLMFSVYLCLHFALTLIPRFFLTSISVANIKKGKLFFNTLIIGNSDQSLVVCKEIEADKRSIGMHIVGFVYTKQKKEYHLSGQFPELGSIDRIREILDKYTIEEVIIALDPAEHHQISDILNQLAVNNIIIKAIPSMYDILAGKVKISHIFATPLIQVSHDLMPVWQENAKQLTDIVLSVIALILLSPMIIFLSFAIKLSSPGPVVHSQERIGRFGKPFYIYKFRSMYMNAERNGPELSSKDDNRLTKAGRFMRKFRLDEIPNFINVLKGEMSIVGPRPERQFYIDKIVQKAPHYVHLHKVKPGITSLGQVKYGYAENIDQMIQRLQFDILYIKNMSLLMDLKIIFYTIVTILKGKGI